MHLIRPFAGLRPASGRAAEVIAPPYDVLSSDEARTRAAGKPWTFLLAALAGFGAGMLIGRFMRRRWLPRPGDIVPLPPR